jgi:hypothetical protein
MHADTPQPVISTRPRSRLILTGRQRGRTSADIPGYHLTFRLRQASSQ